MKMRRIGFLLDRLLQNRTRWLCVLAALAAIMVSVRWAERRVDAQTASPPAVVTTTQLGISPGAPAADESTEPVPAAAENSAAPVPGIVRQTGPRTPLAEDSENLVKLANSLKTDVDKTTKDMLSVNVVREAGQIEQLAHRMRAR